MDRRSRFFLGGALVCLLLVPVAERKLRYVPIWLAVAYTAIALLSYVDTVVRRRR